VRFCGFARQRAQPETASYSMEDFALPGETLPSLLLITKELSKCNGGLSH
jgi:hypothetical protein